MLFQALLSVAQVFLHSHGVTYRDSMTYALDYAIHRDAVDGSGGGITSTGRSEIAQGMGKRSD